MLRCPSALLRAVPSVSRSGASARRIARRGLRRLRAEGHAQRRVVQGLRSVARQAGPRAPHRRFAVLLVERAALVRSELLEVAALLEMAAAPDPGLLAELHQLLTDGCSSPLYNRAVQVSELRAILFRARLDLSSPALSGSASAASQPRKARMYMRTLTTLLLVGATAVGLIVAAAGSSPRIRPRTAGSGLRSSRRRNGAHALPDQRSHAEHRLTHRLVVTRRSAASLRHLG